MSITQFLGIFSSQNIFQKLWPILYKRAELDLRSTKLVLAFSKTLHGKTCKNENCWNTLLIFFPLLAKGEVVNLIKRENTPTLGHFLLFGPSYPPSWASLSSFAMWRTAFLFEGLSPGPSATYLVLKFHYSCLSVSYFFPSNINCHFLANLTQFFNF